MAITSQEVEQVAALSRLELSAEQAQQVAQQLNTVLNAASKLQAVNTIGIEPTIHIQADLYNVLRRDVATPSLSREQALGLAADHEDGYFKVPKIMEG